MDGYYAIFPRAGCGDSMNVWCSGMNGSSPKEYIDLDPMLNYAVSGGLDDPCVVDDTRRGKTWFNKVRKFIISYHNISYHITSYHITSHHITCYITSYHITSYHIIS